MTDTLIFDLSDGNYRLATHFGNYECMGGWGGIHSASAILVSLISVDSWLSRSTRRYEKPSDAKTPDAKRATIIGQLGVNIVEQNCSPTSGVFDKVLFCPG